MRKSLKLVLATALLAAPVATAAVSPVGTASAAGTTYYVDASGGSDGNSGQSSSAAWQTLAKVNATTFAPGDKILFKSGSSWTGQLWPKGSGASGNPIVIDRYGTGAKPAINGGGSSFTQTVSGATTTYNSGTVFLKNQEYWEINNLDVSNDENLATDNNSSTALRAGVFFAIDANASDRVYNHIYIRGVDVHDVDGYNNPSAKANGGIIGMIVGTYNKTTATSAHFNDIRIENNTVRKVDRSGIRLTDHSLYLSDDSFSTTSVLKYGNWDTNVYVGNNTLSEIGGDGIVVRCTDAGIVERNTLTSFGTHVTSAIAGIWATVSQNNIFQYNEVYGGPASNQDGMAYDLDLYLKNTTFQYNYSHDNPQGFLLLMGNNEGDVVRYNISQNDGIFLKWVSSKEKTPAYLYNNIYYYDGAKAKMTADDAFPAGAGLKLYNNVFYNKSSTPTNWGTVNWADAATFSNNVFYEAGGTHPASEPADSAKVTANPGFANAGSGGIGLGTLTGYQLSAGSPLINHGLAVSGNGGQDFWGNPLYNGTPDIGAHEKTGAVGSGTEYAPSADAFVRDGSYAGTNYGTATDLMVKSDASGYARKTYLKFSFSSFAGSTAASAKLRLYVSGVNTDALRTLKVYSTGETWTETGLTWNNAPATVTAGPSVNIGNASGVWIEIDVTALVNANMDDKQISLLLVNEGAASSKGDVQSSSREASTAANRPLLVIS
ncbi:CBM96 family carbohydrate-binding protein [Cohnella sp. 56]|uniref:CBM96 family carbohydrate-binding protein n=1 Tax=Cohnella sp. 56 TaxID=3113722 RepID=UPI0030E926EC